MHILLATGIYPPEIGGPATYVHAVAKQLTAAGVQVTVVTYASCAEASTDEWPVIQVAKWGGPLLRWWRYSRALRKHGANADIIYAFSSVSCGVPLALSRLKKSKRVLRLGGDFAWERATDRGCNVSLREWYESQPTRSQVLAPLLNTFDQLIFSTHWQRDIYAKHYRNLPPATVIENALSVTDEPVEHSIHEPFRLLSIGRFVRFKNLLTLLEAMAQLPDATLTLIGSGPEERRLRSAVDRLQLRDRVAIMPPARGAKKAQMLAEHDLFVVPSLSDISPNAALEASASGLPVLLTQETGLSPALTIGMTLSPLRTAAQIVQAVEHCRAEYPALAAAATAALQPRGWEVVTEEHRTFFSRILAS